MSKALPLMVVIPLIAACSSESPRPTGPISVPVVTQQRSPNADPNANANGGNFGTPLSSTEEPTPPNVVESNARGNAIFHLNEAGNELSYKLIVANIENVFQAHIHIAQPGVNGPIVVWLFPSTAPVAGPVGGGRIEGVIAEGTIGPGNVLSPAQLPGYNFARLLNDLRTGNAYVNVHTNDGVAPTNTGPGDFPGGEVRGQVEHRGH